jgi:hypothetical protein
VTVLETAHVLGWFAAVVLSMAAVAWVKLLRGPAIQRLDDRLALNPNAEPASKLLMVALGLAGMAAVLAIAGWFAR